MKRTLLIAACAAVLVVGAGLVVLRATPTIPVIPAPTLEPSYISYGKPALVLVTARLADLGVIPDSVNLIRSSPTGTTVIGQLKDDGIAPDEAAGDGLYVGAVTFDEPQTGLIQLQLSAAIKGLIRRVMSIPTALTIS